MTIICMTVTSDHGTTSDPHESSSTWRRAGTTFYLIKLPGCEQKPYEPVMWVYFLLTYSKQICFKASNHIFVFVIESDMLHETTNPSQSDQVINVILSYFDGKMMFLLSISVVFQNKYRNILESWCIYLKSKSSCFLKNISKVIA